MKGHVYVFGSEEGPVKIGISVNPASRLREITCRSGRDLSKVFISPEMSCYQAIEKYLHGVFARSRRPGEWFDIDFDEAVSELEKVGVYSEYEPWIDTDSYVQGSVLRARIRSFLERSDNTGPVVAAFMEGFGEESMKLVDYADYCDLQKVKERSYRILDAVLSDEEMASAFKLRVASGLFDSNVRDIDRALREAGIRGTEPPAGQIELNLT